MYVITRAAWKIGLNQAIIKYRHVTEHTAMGSSGIGYDSRAFNLSSSSYRHSLRPGWSITRKSLSY